MSSKQFLSDQKTYIRNFRVESSFNTLESEFKELKDQMQEYNTYLAKVEDRCD